MTWRQNLKPWQAASLAVLAIVVGIPALLAFVMALPYLIFAAMISGVIYSIGCVGVAVYDWLRGTDD